MTNIPDIDAFITEKEMILDEERRSLTKMVLLLKELVLREIGIMIKGINVKRKVDCHK